MRADELEGVLNAHAFVKVERPPQLWAPATDLESFIRLLGEMLAAGLVRNGNVLESVALNVSNVTVPPDDESAIPAGDFAALTIRTDGDWAPEVAWHPSAGADTAVRLVSADLERAAANAGAVYGYTRASGEEGSVTVFLAM